MSQKQNFLNSAQKHLAKGQIDRAVRDYEQVVAIDPQDIRHRQKLAELLVRVNRRDDAVREYETIARYYSENSFYLKAIAVYKQVQRIDPDNIELSLKLGDLNEKQGLKGNAVAEYQTAVEFYERTGNANEAVKVLDRMLGVDASNIAVQIRKGEVYLAAGLKDNAYQEYILAAVMMEQRNDADGFRRLCERVRTVFPERLDFILSLAKEHIRSGDPNTARRELQGLLKNDPRNLEAWLLLADAGAAAGDAEAVEKVLRSMLPIFPAEPEVKQRLLDHLASQGRAEEGLALAEEWHLPHVQPAVAERWYKTLLEKMPGDIRIFEGLKKVYEASGERRKLSDTIAKIDILSRVAQQEAAPRAAASPVPAAPAPAAPQPPATGGQIDDASFELDLDMGDVDFAQGDGGWEEEIDLSPAVSKEPAEEEISADPVPPPAVEPSAKPEGDVAVFADEDHVHIPDEALPDIVLDFDDGIPAEEGVGQGLHAGFDLHDLFLSAVGDPSDEVALENGEDGGEGEDFVFDLDSPLAASSDLPEEDLETHYNLGIAYREMGLLEEAVSEFRRASADPLRKVSAMTLQGMCHRDQGDIPLAEGIFGSLLSGGGLAPEEEASLAYELALLYEACGKEAKALEMYDRSDAASPGFRDALQKKMRLQGGEEEEELAELDLLDEELEPVD